jgi:hypothetical protein
LHRAVDEAEQLKLARERFHLEADLEAPAPAGQCLDRDGPRTSILRDRIEQRHAARDDRLKTSRPSEFVE